ncbi:MAG TPA: alpha/beta fold hydrolase [Anaeromyxobacteraceae bacterium]|nr:alpha/beta fold hydrolase [Anaeromyxobacteraceae bacterium]
MAADRIPAPPLPGFIARELPFERYRVRVEGLLVHVVETGAHPPTGSGRADPLPLAVVLLPGNPTWSFLWRKVARALEGEGMRLVMPDLVGLGLSDKPRDPRWHSLSNHAQVVASLLDALALERVVLVVHDWGGAIGLLACADRLERIAGLVVTNTVLAPPRPGFRPSAFHRFARMPVISDLAFRWLGFPQNVLHRTQGDRASIRGDVAAAYRWPLRARADRVAPLAMARMAPLTPGHPSLPPLARAEAIATGFRGPAAIVWGDHDPILGRAFSRVANLLPHASVTHTPGGHYLQEEHPQAIAAAIRAVVAQVGSA